MTYLEKLLDGAPVEWRPLGEVCKVIRGERVTKKDLVKDGAYPVVSGGAGYMGFLDRYNREACTITVAQYGTAGVLAWQSQRFWANDVCYSILPDNSQLNNKFLYYFLATKQAYIYSRVNREAYPPSLARKELLEIEIPLPPLAVQQQIVEILDKFTALEAELEAELEARGRQFRYYRNKLLRFGTTDPNVQWCRLGDIGTFVRGNGLQKKDFTETGVPCIHYGQIYMYYGMFATETKSFVSEEAALKFKKAQQGDLIIATTSENVRDLCKTVVWLGKEEICISAHSAVFHHYQNPKYLAFYFQTPWFLKQKERLAKGTTVIDISVKDLMKIEIPLPPLAVQQQIVAVLNKFDTLVHSMSEGLPAEIALRRRQYEYYRNLLLRFPPPPYVPHSH